MSAQLPDSLESKSEKQPDEAVRVNYTAPCIEKTSRLVEVTGAAKMTGPV